MGELYGFKHGATANGQTTLEYRSWTCMKTRCYNPNAADFPRYGARGIRVCDRWLESFENFLADMGLAPGPGYTVERLDNDGDYCLTNCKWATQIEQSNNRRNSKYIEFGDKKQTYAQWAREFGWPLYLISVRMRIWNGDIEKVLTTPHRKRRPNKEKK